MADDPGKLIVNGREYPIPDTFTMGELADIEEITGQGYKMGKGGVRGTLALVYVAMHRADARVTVDDVRALGPDDFEIKAAVPPPSASPSEGKPNENATTSSDDSPSRSEGSDRSLNGTGSPDSAIGAISESPTSVT